MAKKRTKTQSQKAKRITRFVVAAVFIAGIVPIYFMFFRDSFLFTFSTKWHFGASGYRDGLNESRIYFKPMLIVVNQSRCRQCDVLQERVWKNDHFSDSFKGFLP